MESFKIKKSFIVKSFFAILSMFVFIWLILPYRFLYSFEIFYTRFLYYILKVFLPEISQKACILSYHNIYLKIILECTGIFYHIIFGGLIFNLELRFFYKICLFFLSVFILQLFNIIRFYLLFTVKMDFLLLHDVLWNGFFLILASILWVFILKISYNRRL